MKPKMQPAKASNTTKLTFPSTPASPCSLAAPSVGLRNSFLPMFCEVWAEFALAIVASTLGTAFCRSPQIDLPSFLELSAPAKSITSFAVAAVAFSAKLPTLAVFPSSACSAWPTAWLTAEPVVAEPPAALTRTSAISCPSSETVEAASSIPPPRTFATAAATLPGIILPTAPSKPRPRNTSPRASCAARLPPASPSPGGSAVVDCPGRALARPPLTAAEAAGSAPDTFCAAPPAVSRAFEASAPVSA
mmetsp:Transcript_94054/g.255354  ORF Transcript_94054/g.255354 Transcript_94054/m.255354 type:complete len:248 (+) Transcript_94054:478-1221(+)